MTKISASPGRHRAEPCKSSRAPALSGVRPGCGGLATPQWSVILPSRTRITSTVSNWIFRPVGAMPCHARAHGRY
jgi:hypothetical protein